MAAEWGESLPNVLAIPVPLDLLFEKRRVVADQLLDQFSKLPAWTPVASRARDACDAESILSTPLVRAALAADDAYSLLQATLNAQSFLDLDVVTCERALFVTSDGEAWSPDGKMLVRGPQGAHLDVCVLGSDDVQVVGSQIGHLIVDRKSPLAKGLFKQKAGFVPLLDDNMESLIEKLGRALAAIENLHPQLSHALTQHVRTIVVSEVEPSARSRVVRHGASSPLFPGVIFMNDYHRPEISCAELAENLVHEFCHTYLFAVEELEPWYSDEAANQVRDLSAQSAWSDRTLPYYSFFHSLVVFATVGSWTSQALGGDWDEGSRDFLRNRLSELHNGFRKVKAQRAEYKLDSYLFSSVGSRMIRQVIDPWLDA